MSNDYEATESLTENSENLSEDNETNDLDLFDDDSSQEEDDAHESIDWEARAKKAEKKVVELKKTSKSAPSTDIESIVDKRLAEREFFRDNPEAKELDKEIRGYTKKGLSLEKAYKLAQMDAESDNRTSKQARSNRATLASNSAPTQSQITLSELEKLPIHEYNTMRDRIDKGEVRIKK
jgi:hypothetical protein